MPRHYSSLISSVAKARQYCQEPERVERIARGVVFQGDHSRHVVLFVDGLWQCDCEEWGRYGMCRHIRALEMLEMVTGESFVPAVEFQLTPALADRPALPG